MCEPDIPDLMKYPAREVNAAEDEAGDCVVISDENDKTKTWVIFRTPKGKFYRVLETKLNAPRPNLKVCQAAQSKE